MFLCAGGGCEAAVAPERSTPWAVRSVVKRKRCLRYYAGGLQTAQHLRKAGPQSQRSPKRRFIIDKYGII